MPVDPQIQALLDRGTGVPATHTLPVAEERRLYEARIAVMAPPAKVAKVEERRIDGPGGPIELRIYTPVGTGPFPLMVFFHGSGFVLCSLDTHDRGCRNYCNAAGCVVVSVDYRLAPEHKFPAGPEDCYAATSWAAAHAGELNANAAHIVLAGDSAGGNMVAVTALMARDRGGPPLCGQLMIVPVTGYPKPGYPSYVENAQGYGLTAAGMRWYWGHYLNNEAEADNPYASPVRAANLRGLPPALIITAELDVLRDEGEDYGKRLADAGVPTQVTRYEGVHHGFFGMQAVLDKSKRAMEEVTVWLKQRFAS